jgi:hypothetical protein
MEKGEKQPTMSVDFPYRLTAHAARVLQERAISLEWVARTMAHPGRVEPDEHDPALRHRLAAIPEYGGRVLRVICDETSSPWTIITAYFDRRLRGAL